MLLKIIRNLESCKIKSKKYQDWSPKKNQNSQSERKRRSNIPHFWVILYVFSAKKEQKAAKQKTANSGAVKQKRHNSLRNTGGKKKKGPKFGEIDEVGSDDFLEEFKEWDAL